MAKKRILIVANTESTIYCFRREVIKALAESGYEIFVSYPRGKFAEEIENLGCTVVDTKVNKKGKNIFEELKLISTYNKLIRELKPDLVVTYTIKPNIYASLAAMSLKVPYINTVTGLGEVFQRNTVLNLFLRHELKKAFKKSQMVFLQNTENLQKLKQNKILGKNYTLVSGAGVNLELHSFTEMPQAKAVKFVTVSHLLKDKGYDELLDAIELVKGRYADAEFQIIGRMPNDCYKERVEAMQLSGKIVYLGEVKQEQVHEIEVRSHCLIHASHHEGMSNAIMEACATGRPVIASDIAGCREAVEDGKNGYLFTVCSREGLVDKIEKFLNLSAEELKRMGQYSRQKMEREFDRKAVIAQYKKCIDAVLEEQNERV